MGIMLYPGLMDPDMAAEAERRSPPSSRGQDITTMLVTTLTTTTLTIDSGHAQVFNTMVVFYYNDNVIYNSFKYKYHQPVIKKYC